MNDTDLKFLSVCKYCYLKDFHPFDEDKIDSEPYKEIIELAKELIRVKGLQEFLGYLQEGQYWVHIWAAKLGLEYGKPSKDEILWSSGIETIIDYCIEEIERNVSYQATA